MEAQNSEKKDSAKLSKTAREFKPSFKPKAPVIQQPGVAVQMAPDGSPHQNLNQMNANNFPNDPNYQYYQNMQQYDQSMGMGQNEHNMQDPSQMHMHDPNQYVHQQNMYDQNQMLYSQQQDPMQNQFNQQQEQYQHEQYHGQYNQQDPNYQYSPENQQNFEPQPGQETGKEDFQGKLNL